VVCALAAPVHTSATIVPATAPTTATNLFIEIYFSP